MSKEDPKHGRWILPLVVLALVLFTYTFVNNLPPAETPTTTTPTAGDTTTTTEPPEETTTTTLAPEIVDFVAACDSLAAEANTLQTSAQTINDDYDNDTTGYGATRDALSDLRVATADLNDRVVAMAEDDVPDAALEQWSDVMTAAAAMQSEADNMFDGLVNTSGSERRKTALENYNIAAATFDQALDDAKQAAIEAPADA